MTRRTPRIPTVLFGIVAALMVILVAPVEAQAAFDTSASQSISVSSGTLASPTAVTLTSSCGSVLANPATITANWTATASTYATGYTITPYLNGVAQTAVAVTGLTTTTATMSITRNALAGYNYWTFTIAASFKNWTSSTVSPTPASVNCPFLSV